jgi:hypothetical protein
VTTNVLILGAGASKHYDFPLAAEIVHRVHTNVDSMVPRLRHLEVDPAAYDRVVERLLTSGCTSIDQFAEYLINPGDIVAAKALLAYHIAYFEVRGTLSQKWASGSWYELLANRLIGQKIDTFPERDIAVITFNYDRSLEQYLLDCLTSRFGSSTAQVTSRSRYAGCLSSISTAVWGIYRGSRHTVSPNEPTSRSRRARK